MGFLRDEDPGFRSNTTTAPPATVAPDVNLLPGAAFRQSNVVASLYNQWANSGAFEPDPNHNPLDTIRGTPYEARHLDNFVASRSEAETRAIMRRIDAEENDRKILEASGAGGVLMSVLAGTLDPTILLPGSIAVKAGRGGYEFGRAALNVGAAGALQAGVQEIGLQATQETRTLAESAIAVGSATLLAGLIGGAASRLLTPVERATLEQSLDRVRADIDAHAGAVPGRGVGEPVQTFAPPLIPEPGRAAAEPLGLAESVGAAATDARTLELMPSIPGTSMISPTRRVLEGESVVGRRVLADLAETPYSYRQSREGVAATQGPTVDRVIKMAKDGTNYQIGQELDRLFKEYRFGAEPPALARARAGFEDLTGQAEGKMSYADFKREVSTAWMNGGRHDIPQVAAAAQFIVQKLEPWSARAENAIEGFKRMTPPPGEGWFPHNWNKEKIRARRAEFTDKLTALYKGDQTTKAASKERLTALSRDLEQARANLAKAKDEDAAAFFTRQHDDIRTKIEDEIAAWTGKSTTEAKSAIKAREKYAADTGRAEENIGKGPVDRLEGADNAIDRAVKKIIASDRDLSDHELRSTAQQTVDRILGSPDGRLPYDVFKGGSGGPGDSARGSLARRQLDVTNAWAREWIEDDVEHVVNSHLRTFVPDVVLAEKFGDVEMSAAMRAINEDYAKLADAARGSERKQRALGDDRDVVIKKLAGVRDRIRGIYGQTPGTENLARVATAVKQINSITSMGMSAIASITDFAGTPIRYGLQSAFADGWAPFFKAMVGKSEGWEKHKAEWRALGIGVDTTMNLRQHAMDDIIDGYKPQSRVERALQWTSDKFFVANMLSPLTDMQKGIATSVASANALRWAKASSEGKATKAMIRDLADAGIDANMASRIHRQAFELGHAQKVDGVWLPNTADWTDEGAKLAYQGAVARATDIAVVTPGQEKPLLMSRPVGSLLMQFKAFPAAATERILISNLQRRDAKALQGVMVSLALGMLSYKVNSMLGGQKTSERPQDWVKEAISRSGVLGWLEEGNAMAAKFTRGGLDVHKLYGADKPLSRYASRSALDSFLGPTAGKVQGLFQVGGAASSGEWSESDTKALRRLMFFQNLVWLRGALNHVEGGANSYFNVPEKRPN